MNKPLTKTDVINIFQIHHLINYFVLSEAFNELINEKQIIQDIEQQDQNSSDAYMLSDLGKKTIKIFNDTISSTVREKTQLSAQEYFQNLKLNRDNTVKINKVSDGYMVLCTIKDIGSDLMTINLFAPDKYTALQIKKNFIKEANKLYLDILFTLTKDKK